MQRPSTIDIEMQRDRALATKNYRYAIYAILLKFVCNILYSGLVALSMYLLVTSDYAIAIGYQLVYNPSYIIYFTHANIT